MKKTLILTNTFADSCKQQSFRILRSIELRFTALFFFGIFSFSPAHSGGKKISFWDNIPNSQLAAQIIEEMTDEELLAQTFMFSWAGQEPDGLIVQWVVQRGLGSIKIFGWNTQDSYKLASAISMLQKKSCEGRFNIPLFTATDQEGGRVRHVKGRTSDTPGNLAIGASGLPYDAYYSGYYISRELRTLGININFAPSVDLYTNHLSVIIGARSFGENPEAVGRLGTAFMKGCRDAGVLATAKHFPGHGDTEVDSHGRLPKIRISEQTFRDRELVPFQHLIKAGIPLIMSGHLNFPEVMKSDAPATFSAYLLNGILRTELGFQGLIVTDDIMMNGAINYAGNISKAVTMALAAGNDIVESSVTPSLNDKVWTENIRRIKTEPAFKARVKDAAARIIKMKLEYFKNENHVPIFPDISKIDSELPNKDGQAFFMNLAARSATLVYAEETPCRFSKTEKIVLASNYRAFLNAGKKRLPHAAVSDLSSLLSTAYNAGTIIFCLSDSYSLSVLQNAMKQYPEKKYIIISILSPVHLTGLKNIHTAIAVYSYSEVSFTAAFAALMGDFLPAGVMPLNGIQ